jgi:hypothetical protein
MRRIVTLFLFLLSSLPALSAELRTVEAATDALVSALVDSDAVEYPKARRIHYPKGKTGLVFVFFTIENFDAGNNYTQYLAVFEPSWKFDPSKGDAQQTSPDNIEKYRLVGYLPVGGKGLRSVDSSKIILEKQTVTIQTKKYASGDAMCCPSEAGTATFKIEGRQLIEVKPN